MANGETHTRFINKQLLTTVGLILSLLFIIVDKAFLQIGTSTARLESRVQTLEQIASQNKERLARLEELANGLRSLPYDVAKLTEATETIKKVVEKLDSKFDAHTKENR